MTTVTTITAATPATGIVGPTQGNAAAGFEALLAAFFGDATTIAPVQGAGPALAPAPAAPMLLDGDATLDAAVTLAGQPTVAAVPPLPVDLTLNVAVGTPAAAPALIAESAAPLVANLLASADASADADADAKTSTGEEAAAAIDPTLLVDVAAIVAPQPAAPIVAASAQTTDAAPAAAKTPFAPQAPAQVSTAAADTGSVPADTSTASQPVLATLAPEAAPQAQVTTAPVATAPVTAAPDAAAPVAATPAPTTAAATGEAAPVSGKAAPQAPVQTQSKPKAAPAATPAAARTNAPAHVQDKVAAEPVDAGRVEVEAETDIAATAETPVAKADALVAPEPAKTVAAPARAPQVATTPTTNPAAPVVAADLLDALPAAAIAAAADTASTAEAAPEQAAAAPVLNGAAGDVATATAGRATLAAARPRDAKDLAKAEPKSTKVDAADTFRATVDGVRHVASAAAAQKTTDKTDTADRKDPDVEATAATASAHVEDAHGHIHEERSTESARSTSAAPATPHPVRGSPETVADMAAQMIKKLHGKATRFDIELTPGGMGTVDVRIEIQNGRVSAAMIFDNPQAAAELKSRAAELQRSLEQAGFDLSNGGLSFEARDGGEAGRGWRQAQDQNDGRGMRGKAFQNAFDTATEAADIAESGALRLRRGATSSLDVRV